MNEHILEYHVYLVEFYEQIGNLHAAKYHLRKAWGYRK